MNKIRALTGGQASAFAMRQINPGVVPVYPITPQTPIVEFFAKYAAAGDVDSEVITVESEHSALSCAIGAAAAGVRAMTATSSQGLALMFEMLYIASGLRLPIVMSVANRSLSAPINIHCDHSDSLGVRSAGWIQIYCENPQEVYDSTLLAIRLAEGAQTPVMVLQDGFITSHCVEGVKILEDEIVTEYIGKYRSAYNLLNHEKPLTVNPTVPDSIYAEAKAEQEKAIKSVGDLFIAESQSLAELTGRPLKICEAYGTDEAEAILVVQSSMAGTVRSVVEDLRKKGLPVGLIKNRLYRPFPDKEISRLIGGCPVVGVIDRTAAFGEYPPLYSDVLASIYDKDIHPYMESYQLGLGGTDVRAEEIEAIFMNLLDEAKGLKASKNHGS